MTSAEVASSQECALSSTSNPLLPLPQEKCQKDLEYKLNCRLALCQISVGITTDCRGIA